MAYNQLKETIMDLMDDIEWGYDPAYVGEDREDEDNHPVRPDDWAYNNEDLEGGF